MKKGYFSLQFFIYYFFSVYCKRQKEKLNFYYSFLFIKKKSWFTQKGSSENWQSRFSLILSEWNILCGDASVE